MKRVVVLGLMGQYPLGGMAWQVLHHLIGFRRLGCESFYVENSGAPPYSPPGQSSVYRGPRSPFFLWMERGNSQVSDPFRGDRVAQDSPPCRDRSLGRTARTGPRLVENDLDLSQ